MQFKYWYFKYIIIFPVIRRKKNQILLRCFHLLSCLIRATVPECGEILLKTGVNSHSFNCCKYARLDLGQFHSTVVQSDLNKHFYVDIVQYCKTMPVTGALVFISHMNWLQ